MSRDPYEVFGFEKRYALARQVVERRYLELSAALHPDLATGSPEAATASAELNDARAALLDPERRANALLAALGGAPASAEKSLPPSFLMEMMEIREAVEAAVSGGNPVDRSRWVVWACEQRRLLENQVGRLFEAAGDPASESSRAAIRIKLNEWRYIERLAEQLED